MTALARPLSRRTAMLLPLAAACLAALAGCAEETPPPAVFEPLTFDYLPKLRLNVSSIDIDNAWQPVTVPGATHVESLAPVQPVDALRLMGQQRLVPAGSNGHAVMVIEDASLLQLNGQYQGTFQVRLDMTNGDGSKSGFAKASVTATRTITDPSPDAARVALYALVKQMMTDMNAEFEYQIRKSLRDVLQTDSSGPVAAPAPVQSQDLAPPQ